MTNDLANELKALIEEGGYQKMTVEPLKDGEWCSISTMSDDVNGDNIAFNVAILGTTKKVKPVPMGNIDYDWQDIIR